MSQPRPTPPATRPNPRRAGAVGAPAIDARLILLENAGITPERVATGVAKAFEKNLALIEATTTKFFQHEGEVTAERTLADNAAQLKAVEAMHAFAGSNAPPTSKKIEVVYHIEIPAWFRGVEEPEVLDVVGTEVPV